MKRYIVIVLILAILLAVAYFASTNMLSTSTHMLLTQQISNHQIRVFMLLVDNTSDIMPSWEQKIHDAFFSSDGVDAFYFNYDSCHFLVYYDRVNNNNFIGQPFQQFPENAITYYYSLINGTSQQTLVNSCNILYTMYVDAGTQPDCFQCQAQWFMNMSDADSKFLIAHEFGHWFGAWDRYYGSPNYNASDPYNSVNLMSVNWGWGNLILAPSTLSDILPQTNNWTQIGPRWTAWFFFTSVPGTWGLIPTTLTPPEETWEKKN